MFFKKLRFPKLNFQNKKIRELKKINDQIKLDYDLKKIYSDAQGERINELLDQISMIEKNFKMLFDMRLNEATF